MRRPYANIDPSPPHHINITMPKLYDKDDPNQVVDAQAPYGDEATGDDPSPAAMHGRIVRLETNAKLVATNEGLARVEGKIDTVDAKLSGKIDTVKAETKAGIAELKGEIKELKSENARLKNLLYTIIGLLVAVLVKDNQTIANIINSLANFFR